MSNEGNPVFSEENLYIDNYILRDILYVEIILNDTKRKEGDMRYVILTGVAVLLVFIDADAQRCWQVFTERGEVIAPGYIYYNDVGDVVAEDERQLEEGGRYQSELIYSGIAGDNLRLALTEGMYKRNNPIEIQPTREMSVRIGSSVRVTVGSKDVFIHVLAVESGCDCNDREAIMIVHTDDARTRGNNICTSRY